MTETSWVDRAKGADNEKRGGIPHKVTLNGGEVSGIENIAYVNVNIIVDGGIIGGIVMVLFIRPVAEFGLKFGPWEIFSLVFFSLTIIATLGGKSFFKGMASGFLGLMMAMVGTDNTGGLTRFTFDIPDGLPPLPRLGILIELPREYEQLTWYGRGPWDNYPDRKVSCPIGLWKSTISQQYVHYPRPQDSGNHEDCTMVELKTKRGKKLRIEAVDQPFSFSALPYSARYLASKTHDYELEDQGKTYLSIDCAVMGLGNSSCGPGVLKKYTIDKTKKHQLRIKIKE